MSTTETKVKLTLASSQYEANLARARALTSQFSETIASAPTNILASGLGNLARLAGPAALGAAMVAGIKSSVDYAAAMNDLGTQAGITATQARVLFTAFENAGLGGTSFIEVMIKAGLAIDKAATGNKDLSKALDTVGLSAKDLNLMDKATQMKTLVEAIDPTKPEHMAAAVLLLGEQASKAFPALQEAAGSLGTTNAQFDSAAASADAFGDQINSLISQSKVFAVTALQQYGRVQNYLLNMASFGFFGTKDDMNETVNQTRTIEAELRKIVASSASLQRQQAEMNAQKTKAANLADSEFMTLLSTANIMPDLVDVAKELAIADESYTAGVARRGKLLEEETEKLIDIQNRVQAMSEEAMTLEGDERKAAEKDIKTMIQARGESIKKIADLNRDSIKAEQGEQKRLADLSKQAADDRISAQKELNSLVQSEADKRRDILKAAAQAYGKFADTPEKKKQRVEKDFETFRHAKTFNKEKAAEMLPDILENLDVLKQGKNPLQQGFIDQIISEAGRMFEEMSTKAELTKKQQDAAERAALEAKAGGLAGPAGSNKGLTAPGSMSPEAANNQATFNSTLLSETIRIRTAVESGLGRPVVMQF